MPAPKKETKKRKKVSNLGRGARSKGDHQKRAKKAEDALGSINTLEQQVADLHAKLEAKQLEVVTAQSGAVAAISMLTGVHRRRSSIGFEGQEQEDVDAAGSTELVDEPAFETLEQRAARLAVEIGTVRNQRGRSRSYHENRTFVFACLQVEQEVLQKCAENERPKLKDIAIQVARLMGVDHSFGRQLMANWRHDGSILVHETQERGKGSPGYANGTFIDTARRLAPEHLKAIEMFRRQCHADGGVCSVRTVVQHLNASFKSGVNADGSPIAEPTHPDEIANPDENSDLPTSPRLKTEKVTFTRRCVRYAMRNYLGWSWGRIKPRKTKGNLDRQDVIVAYLRDFGRALRLERDMDSPKIQCQVEGMLKEKGHRWIWTPPYCPWLQPVRQHSSSSSAAAAAARTQRTSGIEPNVRARV
jgi:hypothetical protein